MSRKDIFRNQTGLTRFEDSQIVGRILFPQPPLPPKKKQSTLKEKKLDCTEREREGERESQKKGNFCNENRELW